MTKWDNMTNVTFDEIQPGASASLSRSLSATDIEVLALVSGDVDPFYNVAAGEPIDGMNKRKGRRCNAQCECWYRVGMEHLREA